MKTIKLAILALLVMAAVSCSKDESSPSTHMITKWSSYQSSGSIPSVTEYQYDEQNKLVSSTGFNEYAFERNQNGLISGALNPSGEIAATYSYDDQGRLTEFATLDGIYIVYRTTYTYYDDHYNQKDFYHETQTAACNYYYTPDGNNIDHSTAFDISGVEFSTSTFEYDNKIGLQQTLPFSELPGAFKNKNNVIKQTITPIQGANAIIITVLDYNEAGYAVKSALSGFESFDDYEYLVK